MSARDTFWLKVHQWAAKFTDQQQTALFRALSILGARLAKRDIQAMIADRDFDAILRTALADSDLDVAFARFRAQMQITTKDAVSYFGDQIPGTSATGIGVVFDVLNPNVIKAIQQLDSAIMQGLRLDIRDTVRMAIEQGLQDGDGPRTIAVGLRDVLGLSPSQYEAVQHYREALEGGTNTTVYQDALNVVLRDRRYDATVAAAKEGDYSLTEAQITTLTTAYERKMVAFNAETNARTATLDALKLGQQLSWQDAIDKGIVDGDTLMKSWKGVMDDREREEHVAMEGETVGFDEPYSNGEMIPGESTYNCRCLSIVFADTASAQAACLMGRAARLKRERKAVPDLLRDNGQKIVLKNPAGEAGHFPAFIVGNATMWESLAMRSYHAAATPEQMASLVIASETMKRPAFAQHFRDQLAALGLDPLVARENSAKGQHLVLCGAGPSLTEQAAAWCPNADQIWGCNSALTWLHDQGHRPTHGFTVDQTPAMLAEWASVPDVEYLLASTVHPHLPEFLVGRQRAIRFFHNFVGIKGKAAVDCGDGMILSYEDWLYQILFPPTVRTGAGLNSVNRAIDLALFMGFETITVLGADCAMRFKTMPPEAPPGTKEHTAWLQEEVVMHADGGHALASGATMLTLFGAICPDPGCGVAQCGHEKRNWLTKPDMIISAVWLEMTRRQHFAYSRPQEQMTEREMLAERQATEAAGGSGRIRFVGDTLVAALKDKPTAYLKKLPAMTDHLGKPLPLSNGVNGDEVQAAVKKS